MPCCNLKFRAALAMMAVIAAMSGACKSAPQTREGMFQERQLALHALSFHRVKAENAVAAAVAQFKPKSGLFLETEAIYSRAEAKANQVFTAFALQLGGPVCHLDTFEPSLKEIALDVERLEEFVRTQGYAKDFDLYAGPFVGVEEAVAAAESIWKQSRTLDPEDVTVMRAEMERLKWKPYRELPGTARQKTGSYQGPGEEF
jgi:hypothetical protein